MFHRRQAEAKPLFPTGVMSGRAGLSVIASLALYIPSWPLLFFFFSLCQVAGSAAGGEGSFSFHFTLIPAG